MEKIRFVLQNLDHILHIHAPHSKNIFRNAAKSYPKEKGTWHDITHASLNLARNPVNYTRTFGFLIYI